MTKVKILSFTKSKTKEQVTLSMVVKKGGKREGVRKKEGGGGKKRERDCERAFTVDEQAILVAVVNKGEWRWGGGTE